jgi:hypothetical protein
MNPRFILYGIVALVLLFMLADSSPERIRNSLILTENNKAFFQTECMKEIVGFEYSTSTKMSYCDCVVSKFSESLANDAPLKEAWKAAMLTYKGYAQNPKKSARALASMPDVHFSSGYARLDVLLRMEELTIEFSEMDSIWKELAQKLDLHWKQSMLACIQKPSITPPVGGG